jgi:hypothetical protein
MVRRHGKSTALAREKKKKRERGESSAVLDGLGSHAPKRQREGSSESECLDQVHLLCYFLFKSNCVGLDR